MSSKWHQKKEKKRLEQLAREEAAIPEYSFIVKDQTSAAAMGEGDDQLFEKKISKEEKKNISEGETLCKEKQKKMYEYRWWW